MKNISQSDKIYWHKYINFYENQLPVEANQILEIGVFKGESIKYWRNRYSEANITGIDIIDILPEWPRDNKISYLKMDQSDVSSYSSYLKSLDYKYDIVIEDGSHDPLHQKISLIETINYINPKGIYILEDIHTSHESHNLYQNRLKEFNKKLSYFKSQKKVLMPLQALLLIEHTKKQGIAIEDLKNINESNSLFTIEELKMLSDRIDTMHFYKRTTLPEYCYSCKSNDFDYVNLKCSCGVSIFLDADSMTTVIKLK
ncbi:MAG: hypothetical protein JXQ93_09985 [Flavobacteriaceae bacterium]